MADKRWILALLAACVQALLAQGENYRFASSCYDSPTKSLKMECGPDEMLRIVRAFYGYSPEGRCNYSPGDCTFEEHQNYACVGRQQCSINVPAGLGRPIPKCDLPGLHQSNYFQVEYKCVPVTDTHDICQTTKLTSPSGYISSPGYPLNYDKQHTCQVSVALPQKQKMTLYVIDMNLRDTANGCTDDLYISDALRGVTICGPRGFEELFTSADGNVDITFTAKAAGNNKGFWLYYEAEILPGQETPVPTPTTQKSLLDRITEASVQSESPVVTHHDKETDSTKPTASGFNEQPTHNPSSDGQVSFEAIVGGVIGSLCIVLTILLILLLVQRIKQRRDLEDKKHLPFLDVRNQAFQSNSEISTAPSDSMYC